MGRLRLRSRHRVLCGDSTKAEDVERLMDGEKADMVFTDPPYGMNLETDYSKIKGSKKSKVQAEGKTYRPVIGDDQNFDPSILIDRFISAKNQLWWGADWYYERLPAGGSFVVWNKRTFDGSKEMIGNHFETCWSLKKRRRVVYDHGWVGFTARNQEFAREHPTEKPVALIAQMIRDFDDEADLIVDLFLGSGTTLIAAEQLDRRCFGMEIDPTYCDIIVRRFENLTGEEAVRWDG